MSPLALSFSLRLFSFSRAAPFTRRPPHLRALLPALLSTPLLLILLMVITLSGCASPARLEPVRQFAFEAARDDSFSQLTRRYRDTTRRELPYLSPAAAQEARKADLARLASTADFLRLQQSLLLYLRVLDRLAGGEQYDLSGQVESMTTQLQTWPDSGLDAQRIGAYAALLNLVAAQAGASAQDAALARLVGQGDAPLQTLLAAMRDILRHYARTDEEERKIVLGLFEIELPYAAGADDRLLATLARVAFEDRRDDYARSGERLRLGERHLADIAAAHASLAAWLAQPASEPARAAVLQANRQLRAGIDALQDSLR